MKAIKASFQYHECPVFLLSKEEWVIGTRRKFERIARAEIQETLWAFKAEFLASFLNKYSTKKIDPQMIATCQSSLNEDYQPIILAMIGDRLEEFFQAVFKSDGYESFVSSCDDQICLTKYVEGLSEGYGPLCFRIN